MAFAVLGGIIVVLACLLAWRDHRARRNGARISYRTKEILQNPIDDQIAARYLVIPDDSHDPMTAHRDD